MLQFWKENIKIKNFLIPRFMSAPMDGVTDSPFRQLIRNYSPNILLFTEMRHVATVANSKKEKSLKFCKSEHPLCFQISANSTNFISKAIEKILANKFDMLNLNSGCPAKKVVNSESGSALMANPKKLQNIIIKINEELKQSIPFSLKIRAGFKEKNALQIAQIAQDIGIDFLIIHPRTQPGGFSSELDFEIVKKIKQTVTIPVIFSGNIIDFNSAKQTYEKTGIDGFSM
ncbi:tRNA-dihydrouridine synthase family protein, partial [Candidatus Dependentiae bacterium]